jgi:hypothetical protein
MRGWLFLVFVWVTLAVTGCATTGGDDVSSIPWNRPQTWEGSGSLGGLASH